MTENAASYDPMGEATLADPFPAYAGLREGCPMHRTEQFGHPVYTVARAADVHAILTDPERWSNRKGAGVGYADPRITGDIQHYDPPEHTERRKFARSEFTPTRVSAMAEGTRALAHQLIDGLEAGGRAELHDDFALPLPIIAFIDMLGVPQADGVRIKRWADELVLGLSDASAGVVASKEVRAYVMENVAERRRAADEAGLPGEEAVGRAIPVGLLSTYSLRLFEGERVPLEVMSNMILQLMVAGHETTTSLITNMVWRLLQRRELWDAVCANPAALSEFAVEESLRFDPPVLGLCRTNDAPEVVLGTPLPADTKLMVLYASANRDPAVFSDPDTFRLDRDRAELAKHYSFGWGTHHCMGAHLARQTAKAGLEVLAERLPALRLAGPAERIAPAFLWGRRKLPVAW